MSLLAWLASLFRPQPLAALPTPGQVAPASAGIPREPTPPALPPWPALSAHDRDILIRTLYGEARGEGAVGRAAVVHVIRNRAIARKTSATIECQRPWQFSCWNANDPNRPKMLSLTPADTLYRQLGEAVDAAWDAPDTVQGARHYFAASMITPPKWAATGRFVGRIGNHLFYAGVA